MPAVLTKTHISFRYILFLSSFLTDQTPKTVKDTGSVKTGSSTIRNSPQIIHFTNFPASFHNFSPLPEASNLIGRFSPIQPFQKIKLNLSKTAQIISHPTKVFLPSSTPLTLKMLLQRKTYFMVQTYLTSVIQKFQTVHLNLCSVPQSRRMFEKF